MPFDAAPQTDFRFDDHFYFSPEMLSNLDSATTVFFRRELEFIMPEMFEFTHPRINARRLFPIDRSAGPVSKSITWRQFRKFGQAEIVADYGDDVPIVNARGEEQTTKVRGVRVGAQWDIQEIRAAQQVGRPLERMYAMAAREAMLRQENAVAFSGDSAYGLTGLLSTGTGIPRNDAPTGTWSGASATDILADLNYAANTPVEVTEQEEAPQTLMLPVEQYNLIASTKHGTDTDTTILQHFLRNSPYIREVTPVRELRAAGTGGADIMVAYDRNPAKVRLQVPLDIEQLAPQQINMVVRVFWHMRIGGLTIHKPESLHIVEGI